MPCTILYTYCSTYAKGIDAQVNLYVYVGNDPVNGSDPTGLVEVDCKNPQSMCVIGKLPPLPPLPLLPPSTRLEGAQAQPRPQSPQGAKNSPPSCDVAQRGLQKLGKWGVELGGDVATAGLAIAGSGLAIAEGSAALLQPEGVVAGGLIVEGGADVIAGGVVVGTGGAMLMAAGGTGNAAVSDLVSRVVSSRIPEGFVREMVGNLVGRVVDALPFEFRKCK